MVVNQGYNIRSVLEILKTKNRSMECILLHTDLFYSESPFKN